MITLWRELFVDVAMGTDFVERNTGLFPTKQQHNITSHNCL